MGGLVLPGTFDSLVVADEQREYTNQAWGICRSSSDQWDGFNNDLNLKIHGRLEHAFRLVSQSQFGLFHDHGRRRLNAMGQPDI
ncbi:MAG: hypothetical protein ACI87E_000511 [Mariniblastus sp.]|jgi:hypothetical protein